MNSDDQQGTGRLLRDMLDQRTVDEITTRVQVSEAMRHADSASAPGDALPKDTRAGQQRRYRIFALSDPYTYLVALLCLFYLVAAIVGISAAWNWFRPAVASAVNAVPGETAGATSNPQRETRMEEAPELTPGPEYDVPESVPELPDTTNSWQPLATAVQLLIAAVLTLFVNFGLVCFQAGNCRYRNLTGNLFVGVLALPIAATAFWLIGWGLLKAANNEFLISPLVGVGERPVDPTLGVPVEAEFLFQFGMAAIAGTIVWGAVADRIKLGAYLIFVLFMAGVIYPVVRHWTLPGGWLHERGFVDFAGASFVCSVGGWAGLIGSLAIGPRLGRFVDGKTNYFPAGSLVLVTLGYFVMTVGWLGFAAGNAAGDDPTLLADVVLNTLMAEAGAAVTAAFVTWILFAKPGPYYVLSGSLGGLAAISAGCAYVTVFPAVVIGATASLCVVLAHLYLDRIRIDDPAGSVGIYLVGGIVGTLSVGLFAAPDRIARIPNGLAKAGLLYGQGTDQLVEQLVGVGAVGTAVVCASFLVWVALKLTIGLRVHASIELEGLDAHRASTEIPADVNVII